MARQIHTYSINGHEQYIIFCTGIDGYISEFFNTKESIAQYATENETVFGSEKMSYTEWLERATHSSQQGEIGQKMREKAFQATEKLVHGEQISLDEAVAINAIESFLVAYFRGKDDLFIPVSIQDCNAFIDEVGGDIRNDYKQTWGSLDIINDAQWISYRARALEETDIYAKLLAKDNSEVSERARQDNSTWIHRKLSGRYLTCLFRVAKEKEVWNLLDNRKKSIL